MAEETFWDNLDYLHKNWSVSVVHEFILEVERTMELLKHNPETFRCWFEDRNFRVAVLNKHISLFYSFSEKEIRIHLFWNNHRNPVELKKYF